MSREGTLTPEIETTSKYALLSVFDKTGIVDFARVLDKLGYKIISTGGTAKTLVDGGIDVVPIETITGFPESFDGRIKTINPKIEGGILYDRTKPSHIKQAENLGVPNIEIVVCNLYPFENTISDPDVKLDTAIENIDIGGPTMERSGGKNFKNALVITDPKDYKKVAKALEEGTVSDELRQALAAKTFGNTAFYDSLIATFLNKEKFPDITTLPGRNSITLRYGENPHQQAVVYFEPNTNSPLAKLQRVTGRELSYVNFTDIAAGLESARLFQQPCAVVIKHNNPCGIALGDTITQALLRAVEADPLSAFGGVIVLNKPLDLETAKTFANFKEESGILIDIVSATSITPEAAEFIKGVRKSTGIYTFGEIPVERTSKNHVRFFDGGFILQDWDDDSERSFKDWKTAGNFEPTEKQSDQMKFAWRIIGRIKSNTVIVVDKDLPMTRGIGSGQTSRIGSAEIALRQAGKFAKGGILASDSFFPFDDCVKKAAEAGIGAIVQQGGSQKDEASIDAANAAGIPMVLTGERKFWH